MASYEEQMRRELEQAAKEQQTTPPECPVEGDVDVALGIGRAIKKAGIKVRKAARNVRRSVLGPSSKEEFQATKHFNKMSHGDIPLKKKS